jgi:hypothetical protein
MVRAARLELARDFSHKILNLARLPLRHARVFERIWYGRLESNQHGLSTNSF